MDCSLNGKFGVEESDIITTLAEHFDMLESDQSMSKLEMMRVKDENVWMSQELEDVETRLEDALAKLAGLEEEKNHWLFMEEVGPHSHQNVSNVLIRCN